MCQPPLSYQAKTASLVWNPAHLELWPLKRKAHPTRVRLLCSHCWSNARKANYKPFDSTGTATGNFTEKGAAGANRATPFGQRSSDPPLTTVQPSRYQAELPYGDLASEPEPRRRFAESNQNRVLPWAPGGLGADTSKSTLGIATVYRCCDLRDGKGPEAGPGPPLTHFPACTCPKS